MARKKIFDEDKIIELYKKFGSFNRAALSAGCSPRIVKQIVTEKGIEINTYVPPRFNINSTLKGEIKNYGI